MIDVSEYSPCRRNETLNLYYISEYFFSYETKRKQILKHIRLWAMLHGLHIKAQI